MAALSILVYHCGFLSGAYSNDIYGRFLQHLNIGVVVFFVISGFLLYRPFVAERFGGASPPRIRDYSRRRAARILPAYWVALSVLALYPGLQGLEGLFSGQSWPYYGLVQIYPVYDAPVACGVTLQFCGIPQTWSLAVEASFYLALPLYFLAARRLSRGRSRRSIAALDIAGLAALSVASLFVFTLTLDGRADAFLGFGLTGTFIWFAFGMGLAVASAAWGDRSFPLERHPGAYWGLAAATYMLLAYALLPDDPLATFGNADQIAQRVLYGVISALLVVPAVFGGPKVGLLRRLLAHKAIAWLGLVSFGIFLYHVSVAGKLTLEGAQEWIPGGPFIALVLLTTAITLPIAALSYYLVERPLMRLK